MSDKYLIKPPVVQEPHADPQVMAQGLGVMLLSFLGPLLLELDHSVDKRLIRTLVQAVEAILTFRDQIHGLLLSELGGYMDRLGEGGGGTKRLSRLLHSNKWQAVIIEHFLWKRCDEQIDPWQQQGQEALLLWDGSVLEKPESLESEGLCAVQSSKAKRLTKVKPGYFNPPGKPICVPGMHWIGLVLVGQLTTQGPAMVACMRWWTSRGPLASWLRDEELKVLRQAMERWGRKVMHIFDRGYASSRWLGALRCFATRFTMRWKHQYHLLDALGQQKAAWKIALGKRAWESRSLRDAVRGTRFTARVLAFPVVHPHHRDWQRWLGVARRSDGKPWYLLTSEPVETAEQAWTIVFAYIRRWQIELVFKHCKSELGFQSLRVWDWQGRLKLLGLATLAYAFLLHVLCEQDAWVRRWLIRYACHRTGAHLRQVKVPLARLRSALSKLWLAHPPAFSRRAAVRI